MLIQKLHRINVELLVIERREEENKSFTVINHVWKNIVFLSLTTNYALMFYGYFPSIYISTQCGCVVYIYHSERKCCILN
ncbi:hypothetical protein IHE45_11G007000 [Dioscorea alata]|uniref:Uncharacterized protein n=1 Tax=Dioscorea alata TaxID=55571 RepID=A0ACB7V4D7_DIOAL|nr:hypothetical protein IHE45_11G007000 [Dioscorea alata]